MSMLCLIQARLGSTRLPRKVLADLQGQTVLTHVLQRARTIPGVSRIVIAIPFDECLDFDTHQTVGSLFADSRVATADVLGRFAAAVEKWPDCTTVMRLTGDCPLLAPDLADQVVWRYHQTPGCEYASNVAPGYVDGTDVEVFSARMLRWAQREATDPADREHVTPWIQRYAPISSTLDASADYTRYKWSVDTEDDLARVRAIAAWLPPGDFRFQTTVTAAEVCLQQPK
jgi:Spore coat polysaccharide biosynthesis protein F, CMP-KDO synthetase homolog